jgi:hypothetical protein
MPQQKLVLEEVSQRMGIELPKSGDLSQESQPKPASAADLEEDSQPPEKNPKLQVLLIGLALFSTLGVGTILILWGLGSATTHQVTKKPDSLTSSEQAVKSTPEQQKEVAELKTKLVMEQQKADAARVAQEREKAESPSPSPTPSSSPSPTPPVATATATKPIDKMQSSDSPKGTLRERDKTLLASLQQQKQQELTQLASLRQSRQQERSQLDALRQSRQQETSQLASLHQSLQQEKSQLIAAQSQTASERKNQALLRSQRNENSERTFTPQPARVVQSNTNGLPSVLSRSMPGGTSGISFGNASRTHAAATATAAKAQLPRMSEPIVKRNTMVASQPPRIPQPIDKRAYRSSRVPQPTITPNQPLAKPPLGGIVPQQPRLDWEQASSLANYGGTPTANDAPTKPSNQPLALAGGNAMSPILRLPVGEVVSGKLVTPFYTLIRNGDGISQNSKALATVTIDKAIEVGSGWHLPVGTAIEFELQIADNGMIQAVSKKVTYGNTEISIPPGAFSITGNDNQPLFAQIKEVNGSQLAAADTRAAIFGGAAEVGNVLINSGNSSTVSIGTGTTISTQNNGNPNILGALFKGAFSPIAQTQVNRANAIATKVDKMSKVGYLLPGTLIRVYVAQAATFQIPIDNNTPQTSSSTQNSLPIPAPKVARIDNSITSLTVETPPDRSSTQSVTNSDESNVVAPNPYYTPITERSIGLPQSLEISTQLPTQPQTINPDYTIVPTQPPGTPNQSSIPQPPSINPNYPTAPTRWR